MNKSLILSMCLLISATSMAYAPRKNAQVVRARTESAQLPAAQTVQNTAPWEHAVEEYNKVYEELARSQDEWEHYNNAVHQKASRDITPAERSKLQALREKAEKLSELANQKLNELQQAVAQR